MAVQKLRNYDSKYTFKDTKIFGQIDPGKTPVWGKPVREREFFLFLQILEITSAKIKPTTSTYLFPCFPCLKYIGRNPTAATSKSVHKQPYRTDCTDFWKIVPRF
jgi:hypothetical protein